MEPDFIVLQDIFSINSSFVSMQSLSADEGFTSSVLKLHQHHPLLLEWMEKMLGEYDNSNKDIWGDQLTTSVLLEYCVEEMMVGGGSEIGRKDDISVLKDLSCQETVRIIDHSVLFPVAKTEWKRIFIAKESVSTVRHFVVSYIKRKCSIFPTCSRQ